MCVSIIITLLPTVTCVCMYVCIYMYANIATPLNDCDYIRAVILLLIMKYFVLKIVSYSHTTTPGNLLSSPHKEIHSQNTLTNCASSSED